MARRTPSSAPDYKDLANTVLSIIADPAYVEAKTIVVITDTRQLPGIAHWPYTSRVLRERQMVKSNEQWCVVNVVLNAESGLADTHFTWGGVFLMEMLHAATPNKHILM